MQNSNKLLKKSASEIPKTSPKSSYLSNYAQRKLHATSSKFSSVASLKQEIATVTALALDCIKLNQNKKKLNFCDVSSIVICEDDHSSNESLIEIEKLLKPSIKKRDLQSIAKAGIKYGVKVMKTIANSPNKIGLGSGLKVGFSSPLRDEMKIEKNKARNKYRK